MRGIGRRGGVLGVAVACALLGAGRGAGPLRAAAAGNDLPPADGVLLPLKGRVTVKAEGKTYFIDGPQVIPGGADIRVEANVRIVGINKASLDVQGGLQVHGTQDCWVTIDNVDFSPTHAPDGKVHLDMADLRGCAFVHPEATVYEGGLTIENCCFQSSCKFALNLKSGFLRIMTTEFTMPCQVVCVATKGHEPELAIRTSWMKAVALSGPANATVRDAEIKGGLEAKDFTGLEVDGCDVWGGLSFHQGADASFSKLVLQKCNLFDGATLTLSRPKGDKTSMEKVKVERFFFGDASDKPVLTDKDIARRIQDGADDDKLSVKAFWSKPNERKHEFLDRALRKRAPPAHG